MGFAAALVLLAAFSAAIGLVLRRRLQVSCNCFGSATRRVSALDLARNAAFMLAAAAGLWAVPAARGAAVPAGHVVLAVPVAALVVALLANLGDVVATLRRPFPVEVP